MISLTEFLGKQQRTTGGPLTMSVGGISNSVEKTSILQQIPIETIEVRPESRIVMATDPASAAADRFRLLRIRLSALKEKLKLRSLIITSPLPEDGKSTVALNLATVLAEGGKRNVLLIEADLHRPVFAKTLGIPVRPGLAECLETGLDPISAIRRLSPFQFYLLQAGDSQANFTELLQSSSLSRVLGVLSPHFDWILIDTPPLVPLSDALSLARHADASLLVARADRTPRAAIEEALALLDPKHLIGVVLNGAEGLNNLNAKYSGYYGKRRTY